jgi:hypothetical protein
MKLILFKNALLSRIKVKNRKTFFLFFLLFLPVLFTFTDYGVSWDENIQDMYGKSILNYYLSGFQKNEFLFFPSINSYGGLFDFWVAVLNKLIPFAKMEVRHLFTAIVGLFGFYGCFLSMRMLVGRKMSHWGVLLLALVPTYYGFLFINPKDIPFSTAYIFSIFYIGLLVTQFPKVPKKTIIFTGLSIGAALGVRIGGLLLIAYLGMILLLLFLLYWFVYKNNFASLFLACLKIFLSVFAISYLVMLSCWPYAQLNPLVRPFEALFFMSSFGRENIEVFEGVWLNSFDAPYPRYYLYKYFLINLPEFVLFFLPMGFVLFIHRFIKDLSSRKYKHFIYKYLVIFSLIFPLAYLSIKNSPVYNGSRHFTFVIPPAICILTYGIYKLLNIFSRFRFFTYTFVTVALFYLFYHVSIMIKLHPYQYIYYNSTIGGLRGAYNNYEMEYWVTSNKEAVKKLVDHLKKQEPNFSNQIYKIGFCSDPLTLTYYFPKNFLLVVKGEPDFIISNDYLFRTIKEKEAELCTRRPDDSKILFSIYRDGVPLNHVFDMRKK